MQQNAPGIKSSGPSALPRGGQSWLKLDPTDAAHWTQMNVPIDDATTATRAAKLARASFIKRERSGLHWARLPLVAPAPDIVVDVGAGVGTRGLYAAFPHSRLVLIDALEENRSGLERHLANRSGRVEIAAIGSAQKTATLNVGGAVRGSQSSLLERSDRLKAHVRDQRQLLVRRLDSIVTEPGSIGLKLDIEGMELEAIRGARGILPRVQWIVAEVSLSQRFRGDPMFSGVYRVIREAGFEFRDFVDLRRNRAGDLRMIDAVFVRRRRPTPRSIAVSLRGWVRQRLGR